MDLTLAIQDRSGSKSATEMMTQLKGPATAYSIIPHSIIQMHGLAMAGHCHTQAVHVDMQPGSRIKATLINSHYFALTIENKDKLMKQIT